MTSSSRAEICEPVSSRSGIAVSTALLVAVKWHHRISIDLHSQWSHLEVRWWYQTYPPRVGRPGGMSHSASTQPGCGAGGPLELDQVGSYTVVTAGRKGR